VFIHRASREYATNVGANGSGVSKTVQTPKQFDDPLFKPTKQEPKQFDDPLFKPATVQPRKFDDPLFRPGK